MGYKVIKKNKKAYLDYDIEKEFLFGIKLKGHEVKQIRTGNIDLRNAFCHLYKNELFIYELNVPLYEKTSYKMAIGYESKRKRKLLATKKEISFIGERTHKTGLTLIVLSVGTNGKHIKVKCALAKLRRKIEKKQIIKERDVKRDMDRQIKNFN